MGIRAERAQGKAELIRKSQQEHLASLSTAELLWEYDRVTAIRAWAKDPLGFAQKIFPHHFSRSKATFHDELVSVVFPGEEEHGRKVGVAAPRGFAKSTICSLLLPIWSICMRRRHFVIISSNTYDQATKFLQAIKDEFETNAELKRYFPGLKPQKEKWSQQELELCWGSNRFKVIAKGAEAQLRGLKFLQHRPDLIIIDDGENDEMVRSEQRRRDYQHWLDRVVLPTNPRAWVVKIGTVLHEAALLNRIIRKPEAADARLYSDWEVVLFQALANEGSEIECSTWEAHQPTAELQAERARDPYGFAQEKQNNPVPSDHCPFGADLFREDIYYNDHELPHQLRISITVDPACTEREYSDETVVNTSGWDAYGRLWVLNEVAGKYSNPSDILNLIFGEYKRWSELAKQRSGWDFYAVGIESVSFQKLLKQLFEQKAQAEGCRPYVVELPVDRDKVRRIWRLEPLFRNRTIRLPNHLLSLENQLKVFPNGAHDDRADALAHQIHFAPLSPTELPQEQAKSGMGMTMGEYIRRSEESRLRRSCGGSDIAYLMSLN